jgi:hypothetical protein
LTKNRQFSEWSPMIKQISRDQGQGRRQSRTAQAVQTPCMIWLLNLAREFCSDGI